MQLKLKKIIARESLYLLASITLSVLFYLSLLGYDQYLSIKKNRALDNLEKLEITYDSLTNRYEAKIDKQKLLYEKFSNNYSPYFETYENMWDRMIYLYESDSIYIKFNKIWSKEIIDFFKSEGLNSGESLNLFIESNRLPPHVDKQIKAFKRNIELSKNEVNDLNKKKLRSDEKIELSLIALAILLIFFMLIRYIVYLVMWSMRTLKTPDDNS